MEEAEAYVRSRRLFGTFSPRIVDSWLSNGLQVCPDTGKVTLVFNRGEIRARGGAKRRSFRSVFNVSGRFHALQTPRRSCIRPRRPRPP